MDPRDLDATRAMNSTSSMLELKSLHDRFGYEITESTFRDNRRIVVPSEKVYCVLEYLVARARVRHAGRDDGGRLPRISGCDRPVRRGVCAGQHDDAASG